MREAWLVFARDARAHLRGFVLWTLPVAALLLVVVSIQPSMARQGSALEAKLQMMPAALKQLFGLGAIDFLRPAGYLAVNFIAITITAPLSAGTLGATLIAKEEAMHTAELLLTRPVSRVQVLAGKVGVLALHVLGYHVVLSTVALVGLAIVVDGPVEARLILSLFGGSATLAVCFGGLGMWIATLVARPRIAGSAALGVVLGAYLIAAVGAVSPELGWLAWLSPFHAVSPPRIIAHGGLDPVAAVAVATIGLAGAAAAFVRYARKDIDA